MLGHGFVGLRDLVDCGVEGKYAASISSILDLIWTDYDGLVSQIGKTVKAK